VRQMVAVLETLAAPARNRAPVRRSR
jgi:hypothetical protein